MPIKLLLRSLIATGLLLAGLSSVAGAQSVSDDGSAFAQALAQAPAPAPSTAPAETPLYAIGDEIYTIDRDMTAYWFFQSNYGGSANEKYDYRYGRKLWNDNAQLRIRIPIITKFSATGPTISGLGNIELGYSYGVTSKTLDHYLEARISTATAANGASSNDTELKGFYNLKWKMNGFNVAYSNEYDQTIIKPPGSSWASYYEGKLTFPDVAVMPGLKFSTFYNYRVLFDTGGIFKEAIGGTIFGNLNDVAVSITDSWGIGGLSALWHYKLEANLTARF